MQGCSVTRSSCSGGGNSSEVRVHLGDRIDIGYYPMLGGLLKEWGPGEGGNAQPSTYYEDEKKLLAVLNETNISLFLNNQVSAMESVSGHINSVVSTDIYTGEKVKFTAPLFCDCTGDGTVGYLAGTEFMMGREGKECFGEITAPDYPDSLVMGTSVQWDASNIDKDVSFPAFSYGIDFNDITCEPVMKGDWMWETGMNKNQINDAESIRDYGLLVVYSNWSWLKNSYSKRYEYRKRSLEWVAYIAGKRESRRIVGDYILKEDDLRKNVYHEDRTFATTWTIDPHSVDSLNSAFFPGKEFKSTSHHIAIYPYEVPYRCLYSKTIDNLFMSGRNISASHVALGTARVMRTSAMMG